MAINFKKWFWLLQLALLIVTFIPALMLENAGKDRLTILIVLFVLLNLWMVCREFLIKKYVAYSFIIDILLLIFMEYNSKYIVNYYFSIYYFLIVISIGILLSQRESLVTTSIVFFVSMIKFARLLVQGFSYASFSYAIFYALSFIILIILINYIKHIMGERAQLKELYQKLTETYKELQQKNEKIQQLTIYEERNRIAREIHDAIGHGMTGLIMQLELCEKLVTQDIGKATKQLSLCREIAKQNMSDIRKSVMALKPGGLEKLPLIESVEKLINETRTRLPSTNIELHIQGQPYKTSPMFEIAIFRAIQESITNAVRHGAANQIDININFDKEKFLLSIKDNGRGCEKIIEGCGLTGMKERIEELGGSVSFQNMNGFEVDICIDFGGIKSE